MQPSSTSTNLRSRLSEQAPITTDTRYVQHIRAYVADLPNSGSQQHRLRYGDENWLISQYRWITEHRAAGTDWSKIRRILQAALDEVDVEIELESIVGHISADTLVDAAKAETVAGCYEDSATLDAIQHKSPGTLRRLADYCHAQIEALEQKGRVARTMAAKLAR